MLAGRDGLADGGWGRVPVAQTLPRSSQRRGTQTFGSISRQARLTDYGARIRRSAGSTTTRART